MLQKQIPIGIEYVVTHNNPHLDEVAALWILKKWGTEEFPGIKKAKILFHPDRHIGPNGTSFEELEKKGYLFLGIGGGKFDDHQKKTEKECCATLVAQYLEADDDPALNYILKYVFQNDKKAGAHPWEFANLIKDYFDLHEKEDHQEVVRWAMEPLEVKYRKQLMFLEAEEEFEKKSEIFKITLVSNFNEQKMISIALVYGDNIMLSKVGLSKGVGIIVQKGESGNVQIYINKKIGIPKISLACAFAKIRFAEQVANKKVITSNWEELKAPGYVKGASNWFYHEEGQFFLNGSKTATAPPTKLEIKKILRCLTESLVYKKRKTFKVLRQERENK
ncbi:hypothetical protein A2995_00680 [Candidatus Nomurabacteria bacterium RIFCSPLOWO2_01_FULL_33_24]|uniref:Uncharacterized protein n=1 Tax=Candidatus Nomurabacteria bacterium RIFCSPLOWO2_01_FULL_33_24 TaxID=1801765 RepID=A0A1F6X0W8_9BACT|nr:MAG: hypothetical protein A2995_00680 [Candidatus Nomurabacteria bacterium RIFCSPLOWO2_01_FULL_33_24]